MCVSLKCTYVVLHLSLKPNTEECLNLYGQEANTAGNEFFLLFKEALLCSFFGKNSHKWGKK